MEKLTLNINGRNVDVMSIEDLGDKKRLFVGDDETDLIFKSKTGLKVKIGTKFFDLASIDTLDNQGASESTSVVYEFEKVEEDLDYIISNIPDGSLIYDTANGLLYYLSGGVLKRLTNPIASNTYLSFKDDQRLTAANKMQLATNAGLVVKTFGELLRIDRALLYDGICVYVIGDAQHYMLTGTNSSLKSSWTCVYLSTATGGDVKGPVVLSGTYKTDVKPVLSISGTYDGDDALNVSETENILSIGNKNLLSGLAVWSKSDGVVKLQSMKNDYQAGFEFLTTTGNATVKPFEIKGDKVGINSNVKDNYSNAFGGRSLFQGKTYFMDNVGSTTFVPGFTGYGWRLGRDNYGMHSLEVDNLTVRQRMHIYELIVNQIKATNGSLWVSDAGKIKDIYNSETQPTVEIYIKAKYAGNYKEGAVANTYEQIDYDLRPSYAMLVDKHLSETELKPVKIGFGYGDLYRTIENGIETYKHPDFETYVTDDGVAFYQLTGTHSYDVTTNTFYEDSAGEYILSDTMNVFEITFEDLPPFFEEDLIRMQTWDRELNALKLSRCVVGKQYIKTEGDAPRLVIYVYENQFLESGMSLVRIGNCKEVCMSNFSITNDVGATETIKVEKQRGLKIAGATWMEDVEILPGEPNRLGAVYITASDGSAPYMDVIDNVKTHNMFNPRNPETPKIVEVMPERVKARLGRLANIVDLDMGLDGGTWQDRLYGLYTDSGFFKGNLVAKSGLIGDFVLNQGAMVMFKDGHVRVPSQFVRGGNTTYQYIDSNGVSTPNPVAADGTSNNVNLDVLKNSNNAHLIMDPTNALFALGGKFRYENGVLTIGSNTAGAGEVNIIGNITQVSPSGESSSLGIFRGQFSLTATYYPGDTVVYDGSSYRWNGATTITGILPTANASWIVLAAKGEGGSNVSIYWLDIDKIVLARLQSGDYRDDTLNISGKVQVGGGAVSDYPAIFTIDATTDGTNFFNIYTSATEEANVSFQVTNKTIVSLKVKMLKNSVLVDEQSVFVIEEGVNGKDAVSVVLSNESHTVPADSLGNVTSFNGCTTKIYVFEGIEDRSAEWTFTPTYSNVTATATENNRNYVVTSLTADTGSITITATKGNVSIPKIFNITKTKQGNSGIDGVDPKYVVVTGEQVFKYQTESGTPTPSSITLTGTLFGFSTTTRIWQYWNGTTWTSAVLGANANNTSATFAVAHNSTMFGTSQILRMRCAAPSTNPTNWDEITLVKLYDGETVNIILTNEAITTPCNSDGSNPDLTDAFTNVLVYKGINKLTYNTGYTISKVDTGCISSIATDGTDAKVTVTSFTSRTGSVKLSITAGGVVYTKILSLAKAYAGAEGLKGADGNTGPGIAYRGTWDVSKEYNASAYLHDVVKYNGTFYEAKTQASGKIPAGATPPNAIYWNAFGGSFESIATGLLVAQNIVVGSTNDAGVNGDIMHSGDKWRIYANGNAKFAGGNIIFNSDGSARFGNPNDDTKAIIFSSTGDLKLGGTLSADQIVAGTITTSGLNIGNGVFTVNGTTGHMKTTSAQIGNLYLENNRLYNKYDSGVERMSIEGDGSIAYKDTSGIKRVALTYNKVSPLTTYTTPSDTKYISLSSIGGSIEKTAVIAPVGVTNVSDSLVFTSSGFTFDTPGLKQVEYRNFGGFLGLYTTPTWNAANLVDKTRILGMTINTYATIVNGSTGEIHDKVDFPAGVNPYEYTLPGRAFAFNAVAGTTYYLKITVSYAFGISTSGVTQTLYLSGYMIMNQYTDDSGNLLGHIKYYSDQNSAILGDRSLGIFGNTRNYLFYNATPFIVPDSYLATTNTYNLAARGDISLLSPDSSYALVVTNEGIKVKHGGVWETIAGPDGGVSVDLSNYYTKAESSALFANVTGSSTQNFSTANLTASGNATVGGTLTVTGRSYLTGLVQTTGNLEVGGAYITVNGSAVWTAASLVKDYLVQGDNARRSTYVSGDLNAITQSGFCYAGSTTTNQPVASASFEVIHTNWHAGTTHASQIAINATNTTTKDKMYIRRQIAGTWESWVRVLTGENATKADVGLGNVDNTSDINKPVSTATQTALNLKLNIADFNELFVKSTDSLGNTIIKAKFSLHSDGDLVAWSNGSGTGSGGGGTGDLPIATKTSLGVVQIGSGLNVTAGGIISVAGDAFDLSQYYTKTESDNTFAFKSGSLSQNFSANNLNLGGSLTGNNATLTGLTVNGNVIATDNVKGLNLTVNQSAGTGDGLALYYSGGAGLYGINTVKTTTATYGTHGSVTGDWAIYFNTNNTANRGWIFRVSGTGGVASISNAGTATFNGSGVFGQGVNIGGYSTSLSGQNIAVQSTDAARLVLKSTATNGTEWRIYSSANGSLGVFEATQAKELFTIAKDGTGAAFNTPLTANASTYLGVTSTYSTFIKGAINIADYSDFTQNGMCMFYVSGGLYIRGGSAGHGTAAGDINEMYLRVGGTWQTVYHTGNANLSSVNWTANNLTATGNLVITGATNLNGDLTAAKSTFRGLRVNGNIQIPQGDGLEMWYNPANKTAYIQNYNRGTTNDYSPLYISGSSITLGAATTLSSTLNVTGSEVLGGVLYSDKGDSGVILTSRNTVASSAEQLKIYHSGSTVIFNNERGGLLRFQTGGAGATFGGDLTAGGTLGVTGAATLSSTLTGTTARFKAVPYAANQAGGISITTTNDSYQFPVKLELRSTSGGAFYGALSASQSAGMKFYVNASDGSETEIMNYSQLAVNILKPLQVNDYVNVSGTVTVSNTNYFRGLTTTGAACRLIGVDASNNVYVGGVDTYANDTYIRRSSTNFISLTTAGINMLTGLNVTSFISVTGSAKFKSDVFLYGNNGTDEVGWYFGAGNDGNFYLNKHKNTTWVSSHLSINYSTNLLQWANDATIGGALTVTGAAALNSGATVANVADVGGLRVSGSSQLKNGVGLEIWYNASNTTSYISAYDRGGTNTSTPLVISGSTLLLSGTTTFTGDVTFNNSLFARRIKGSSSAITDLNIFGTDQLNLTGFRYDNYTSTATNLPVTVNNANGVITMYSHPSGGGGLYGKQIAFADNDDIYHRKVSNGTYGSYYKLWSSYNAGTLTTSWSCSTLSASSTINASSSITAGGYLYVNNTNGNLQIGAQNTNYTHFISGNPGFYFNKKITAVDELSIYGTTNVWTTTSLIASGEIFGSALRVNQTACTGAGLGLYGSNTAGSYGINFVATGTSGYGTHGSVTASLAMYFNMSSDTGRGWIFRSGTSPVASIGNTGNAVFNGSVTAGSDVTAYSDARIKKDVKTLETRGDLRPVEFTRTTDNKRSIGFIAQEVQEIYPELVQENEDGLLSLNYSQLTAVLMAEIIELKKENKKIKGDAIAYDPTVTAIIEALQEQVASLQEQINQLKNS